MQLDFMFMGEETGGKSLTIVVAKERSSKAVMASVAPKKSSGEFIARRVVAFMKELGCDKGQVTVKSDNEPAIQAVVEKLEVSGRRVEAEGWWWSRVLWGVASRTGSLREECRRFRG